MALMDFKLGDIGSIFTSAREAITGKKILDEQAMAELEFKLSQLEHLANQGQMEINKVEAASDNLFVAGARPFILWICGISIAYSFLIQPMIQYITLLAGVEITPPILESDTLMSLTISLLGMSSLRTYEKMKGVSREK